MTEPKTIQEIDLSFSSEEIEKIRTLTDIDSSDFEGESLNSDMLYLYERYIFVKVKLIGVMNALEKETKDKIEKIISTVDENKLDHYYHIQRNSIYMRREFRKDFIFRVLKVRDTILPLLANLASEETTAG